MGSRRHAISNAAACLAVVMTCASCMAALAAEPQGPERETREFKVSVDGTPRGKCTMKIHHGDDGVETVAVNAGLTFNFVVYSYRYSSTGTEVWKNGSLVALKNVADFNGKKYQLAAAAASEGLEVTVNGKTSNATANVWATSYWRLPERIHQRLAGEKKDVHQASGTRTEETERPLSIALLDSDTGEARRGKIKRIGHEAITVAGQRCPCTHYRIDGDVEVDLWYDAARRLVREESVDSGHKTVLELARISSAPKK